MNSLNHACPGLALACVPGLPIRRAGLSNDGQSEMALATGLLDCVELSGSLKPSTLVLPRLANEVTALTMLAEVCSAPVWPQIIGTNSPPCPVLQGSVSLCSQL